jgi:hypothetical protein
MLGETQANYPRAQLKVLNLINDKRFRRGISSRVQLTHPTHLSLRGRARVRVVWISPIEIIVKERTKIVFNCIPWSIGSGSGLTTLVNSIQNVHIVQINHVFQKFTIDIN